MLISGNKLLSEVINFMDDSYSILAFSPYVKLEQLKKINQTKRIQTLVVRWDIKDLCQKVSDLEVYEYCKENGIYLYRNSRIHLKVLWNDKDALLFGSANITARGLGDHPIYNYELNNVVDQISTEDKVYLNKIIRNSVLLNDSHYQNILNEVEKFNDSKVPDYPSKFELENPIDHFMLDQLPMSSSVRSFIDNYYKVESLSKLEKDCLIHDLGLYNIELNLDEDELLKELKSEFNRHPFINSLKNAIRSNDRKSMGYGQVVRWIIDNTTTTPTPRSWELKQKQIVNILYDWICFFDDDFYSFTPRHSQVIAYRG